MAIATALVALAALLPTLAAAVDDRRWPAVDRSFTPSHTCGNQGRYAPFSAYEANLRLLAATIPAKVNADPCDCSNGNDAGDSPDRIVASAYCYWRPGAKPSDCGACVALAFREARWRCPYHRQAEAVAVVDGGACSVNYHDYDLMEEYVHFGPSTHTPFWLEKVLELADVIFSLNNVPDVLVVLLFLAIGLGWVVFSFLREWRSRSRGPGSASNDYFPITGEDQ